ncbi:MAG: hypothetical protein ACREDR_30225, partial [Blastocatellia bacterium]
MVDKPSKFTPALIGGIVLGLLSSIPFVNLGNFCCCLWVIVGGAIAAKMLVNRSTYFPVSSGEGASVGALAGVVGSLVYLVIGVPISLIFGAAMTARFLESFKGMVNDPNVSAQFDQALRQMENRPASEAVVSSLLYWLIGSVIIIGVATLGGVIGIALFEKRKGNPPGGYPPQPPNFPGAPYGNPPYGNAPPYSNPPSGNPPGGG